MRNVVYFLHGLHVELLTLRWQYETKRFKVNFPMSVISSQNGLLLIRSIDKLQLSYTWVTAYEML